ncbi:MAG: RAMP superfamily CRISPR-associated protein [Cylindrospermopsis raciborskii 1523720]|uniref:RAMP superfamily CRISPR-associated protein n=1 Tax=Cylindrospermopsis raciborskii TaxID=77022 RepID=UPI002B47FA49|nr:RAMP superfamily CRISPR-associated protein [Cylindrospermopsis raciborskii]MEB3146534.1 RAMP superfamily CRISPR-associated protein [Cylindrospermopsis raciborskii]
MRSPYDDSTVDSGTILELFREFKYRDWSIALKRLTERTIRLADTHFEVKSPWRIRVGGHKGPESMLLPAFDALGMPYIPSSTLRGIARAIAMEDSTITEREVKDIFGDIEPKCSMGKVIFLDAYPLPGKDKKGGLSGDMTNAIWTWNGDKPPEYDNPNPNIFISLKEPTFVIGLRRTKDCPKQNNEEEDILYRVRNWLIKGLIEGIGSRVNSGYGELRPSIKFVKELKDKKIITPLSPIIEIKFELEGQLIHGGHSFNQWKVNRSGNGWNPLGRPISEVRPTAFRSMIRYWFRVLTLGILSPSEVKTLEMEIFGGLEKNPATDNPYTGLFRVEVKEVEVQENNSQNSPNFLSGKLALCHNSQSHNLAQDRQQALSLLLCNLTWLMFHLGGVGQGARRPCYKRSSNPYWRGSTLIPIADETNLFWSLPESISEFQQLFRNRLRNFYRGLHAFSLIKFDHNKLKTVQTIGREWIESVDKNCQIFVCEGKQSGNKCFALSVLHNNQFYRKREVCGGVNPSIPSPIWIRQLNYVEGIDYQVITVFGATSGLRREFVQQLTKDPSNCLQIFPLPRINQ